MSRITLNGWLQYDPTIFDGVILPEDYDRDALLAEIMSRSGELYTYHQVPYVLKENIRLWFSRNFLNFDRMMAALMAEYNPIENYDRHEDWIRTPNLTDEAKHTGSDNVAASGKDSTQLSGNDIDTLSGTDTDTLSGNDTTTRGYTNYNESSTRTGDDTTERTVSAFDSGTYQPAEKTVETFGSVKDSKDISGSYNDKTDYGKVDTMAYGKVDTMAYGRKDETEYGRKDTTTFNSTLTDRHTGDEKYTSRIHGNIGVTTSQQMITSELELRKFDIYEEIAGRFEHEFLVQVY